MYFKFFYKRNLISRQAEMDAASSGNGQGRSISGLLSAISTHSFIMLINDYEALTIVRYLANQRSLFDTFEIYLSPVSI